ncbi:hypothetical protein H0B56_01705 [Haloechinothrix sp. YIM 98757]|uniref:Uncharacterized protein n=1 Tax=Haloechinothrix aidingensis TaxID=2752311 RepID=A0A838A3W4_9PSEU|nr:hypothetical protein [Haloechinothrix aidingensis]MBA0124250.1 hypothetical protein [Haloechinothrix aidingensis]
MIVPVVAVALLAVPLAGSATAGDSDDSEEGAWQEDAGPSILHDEPPRAPQLENTGIWRAEPTQVCMSSAYRAGEFLYQGCLWDDHGGGTYMDWPAETALDAYTYPTDDAYRRNAADLVELRAQPHGDGTAFRITYNTMTDPDLVATTIALGDSDEPVDAPHGANTVLPAESFVTVHGSRARFVDAATGEEVGGGAATVDLERRQVEVHVPNSVFDPGDETVRIAAASGLWDTGNDQYLVPRQVADEDHPGGAQLGDPAPSAFFDVAFRYDEPLDAPWRDRQQKEAIADGDISDFFAEVDFAKLRRQVEDDMTGQREGVPDTGYIHRIYPSHFENEQGRRMPGDAGGPPAGAFTQQDGLNLNSSEGSSERPSGQFGWVCRDDCVPSLAGQLQRYLIHIPEEGASGGGYASLTWLPGFAQTPGEWVTGENDLYQSLARDAETPTAVVAVDGRGSDNWFYGRSGASVFEAIADARRHYPLDPDRSMLGGFSSGAYGANKLSLQFPDAFSKAFICDGLDRAPSFPGVNAVADTLPVDTVTEHEAGSKLTPLLPSRHNQPVMEWAGANDDFIPYNITRERAEAYAAGDYDYEFITWAGVASEHAFMCEAAVQGISVGGTWDVLTDWVGDGARVDDPARVTYVRNPLMDDPQSGLVGDRAYWLPDIDTRQDDELGTVEAFSRGFGAGERAVGGKQTELHSVSGNTVPVNPYLREFRHLPDPPEEPRENRIEINVTNIGSLAVDPAQAQVGCDTELDVTTDGPVEVTLLGCDRIEQFG